MIAVYIYKPCTRELETKGSLVFTSFASFAEFHEEENIQKFLFQKSKNMVFKEQLQGCPLTFVCFMQVCTHTHITTRISNFPDIIIIIIYFSVMLDYGDICGQTGFSSVLLFS